MKKIIVIIIIAIILIAADTPPALPSSFYGTVTGGKVGQTVSVSIGWNTVAKMQTIGWNGQVVYALDVPMGEVGNPVEEGTIAIFKVNGVTAGSAALHSGTNVNLNLAVRTWGWFGR